MWPRGRRALCGLPPPFCPEQRAHVSSRAGRQLGRETHVHHGWGGVWIQADLPAQLPWGRRAAGGSGRVPGMRVPNTPGKQVRVLSALSHENAERGTTCVSGLPRPRSQETAPGSPMSASARTREPSGRCRGEGAGQRNRPRLPAPNCSPRPVSPREHLWFRHSRAARPASGAPLTAAAVSPQVNSENVVKVGHRQVVNMIRQGGNHLVLKVVTVTRSLDPDDTTRKKGGCPPRLPHRHPESPAAGGAPPAVPTCSRAGRAAGREVR